MGVFVCDYIAHSFVNKTSVSAVTGGVVGGDDLPTGRFLFYHFVCFFLFLSLPRLGRKDVTSSCCSLSASLHAELRVHSFAVVCWSFPT